MTSLVTNTNSSRASSPPGIENLHAVASSSAHTLDSAINNNNNNSSISLPKPPVSHDAQLSTEPVAISNTAIADSSATGNNAAVQPVSSIVDGLNEEDAKLLASLSEGNGLFTQLSSLAQASNVNGLFPSLGGTTTQDADTLTHAGGSDDYSGAVDLNEALTRTDMDWDDDLEELEPEDGDDHDQGPIQAYAKLEFPGFSYYVQTLDISIGRRPGQLQQQLPGMAPPQLPNAVSGVSQAHITSESKAEGDVDVDLGPLKSISRLHARIFYYTGPIQPPSTAFPAGNHTRTASGGHQQNVTPYRITSPAALTRLNSGLQDTTSGDLHAAMSASDPQQGDGQFVLSVVGRNGAFVDDVWVERGGLVVLGKRTKIQIAERVFYFILPPPPGQDLYESDLEGEQALNTASDSLSDLSSEDDEDGSADTGSSDVEHDSQADDASDAHHSDYAGGERPSAKSKARRASAIKGEQDDSASTRRRLVLKPKSKVVSSAPTSTSTSAGRVSEGKGKANGKTYGRGKSAAGLNVEIDDDDDSLGTPSAEEGPSVERLSPQKAGKRNMIQASKGGKLKASVKARKGKQPMDVDADGAREASPDSKGAGQASRKRKRGESMVEDGPALKVGTPIGVEALQANKRAMAASAKAGAAKRPPKTEGDDDVVMLDYKAAPAAGSNGNDEPSTASNSPTKAAKAKTTKPKKKKGGDEQTPTGLAAIAPAPSGNTSSVAPTLPALSTSSGQHAMTATGTGSTPTPAVITAPTSLPKIGQPPVPHVLPPPLSGNAGQRLFPSPGSVPVIPGPITSTPKYGTNPPGSMKTEPITSPAGRMPSYPPTSQNPSWPSTASIIASAASLANAQSKGVLDTSSTMPKIPSPSPHKSTPGPDDKPAFSNVDLISQALRSEHCMKKGGKLTLQEVYEWLANRWDYFKNNGRTTGRDWQSSIRHAIGSSREFTRIPRRNDEPGKGIFYTMSTSPLAQQHRENLAKQKEEASRAAALATTNALGANSSLNTSVKAATAGAGISNASSATASASPSTLPAIKIPLIIGTPPSASNTAATKDNLKAAPGTIESLLETPPIVHHDGKLYLSPQVFGHLNAGQLAQIESLGAQQALQVLQAYLVTHLKERMRLQQVSQSKAASASPSPAPSTAPAKPSMPPAPAPAAATTTSSVLPPPPRPVLPAPIMSSASDRKVAPSTMSVAAFNPRNVQSSGMDGKSLPAPAPVTDTRAGVSPIPRPVVPSTAVTPAAPAPQKTDQAQAAVAPVTTTPTTQLPAVAKTTTVTAAPPPPAAVKPIPSPSPAPVPASTVAPAAAAAPSEDPLSALSALAAHPEAAGLIALLRKQQEDGGGQMAKLTAGQLQLLQMANKLAAQQKSKKKKKKNKDGTATPGGPTSGSPAPTGSPAPNGPPTSVAPSQSTSSALLGGTPQP